MSFTTPSPWRILPRMRDESSTSPPKEDPTTKDLQRRVKALEAEVLKLKEELQDLGSYSRNHTHLYNGACGE